MSARRRSSAGAAVRCSGHPACRCRPCDRKLRRRADTVTDAVPTVISLIQAMLRG